MAESASTIFFTVISGTLVYVLGNFGVRLMVDPIKELREMQWDILKHVIENSNHMTSGANREKMAEASQQFRDDASYLGAKVESVIWYRLWSLLGILPSKEKLETVRNELFGLHNGIPINSSSSQENLKTLKDNKESITQIRTILESSDSMIFRFLNNVISSSSETAKLLLTGAAGAITYHLLGTQNYIPKILLLWILTTPLILVLNTLTE